MDDANLRKSAIPVLGDRIEDQAKIRLIAGLEWSSRNRLHIDIWLTHPDNLERLGLVLRHLVYRVAEEHLHGNARDRPLAVVRNVPVHVGDLAASQVGRLAHGQV